MGGWIDFQSMGVTYTNGLLVDRRNLRICMLRILRVSAVALVGLTIVSSASLSAQDLPVVPAVVPQLRVVGVQPGDRITLTLYDQNGVKLNDIGGERTVDGSGLLYLPFLEGVPVQGMTQSEVREALDDAYERFYTSSVVEVEVKYRVNITGSIRSPGTYYLSPNSSLTDAMASAGGASSEVDVGLQGGAADASQVRLRRAGYDEPLVINFRAIEAVDEIVNAPIQSGDWIHVPAALRSQVREDLLFASNILTVLLSIASLIVIISN